MSGPLTKLKNAYHLLKSIDFAMLAKLSEKVDLPQVMESVGKMADTQLNGLMKMLTSSNKKKERPPIEGDFYDLGATLNAEDRALQLKVRAFMEKEIKPIVNEYWLKADFPFEISPKFRELNICGVTYDGYGCPNRSFLMEGIIAMEMARIDASVATFFGGTSILILVGVMLDTMRQMESHLLMRHYDGFLKKGRLRGRF